MSVAVVVPWRGGCPHRERAWRWCRTRYTWPVIEAPGSEPWSKGAAVYPAIERCSADIVVVADADVFCENLGAAVAAVEAGAPWAMPHDQVYRLDEEASAAVLNGGTPKGLSLAERPYPGRFGGGIVVLPRQTFLEIPIDPRFIGWGREDQSWAIGLHYLVGPAWRGNARLYHFWHPSQKRPTRKRGCAANERLHRRYLHARRDRREMESLILEVRRALNPDKPAVHDHPPPRGHHSRRARQPHPR